MSKLKVGIIFGGRSKEREISFAGGRTVYDNLNKSIFEAIPLFVDSFGNFVLLGTILVGAEMNAEIEHSSPYGKESGEKVPGQKRKIGPARMRAWLARQRSKGEKPPSAAEIKEAVGPPPEDKVPPVSRESES